MLGSAAAPSIARRMSRNCVSNTSSPSALASARSAGLPVYCSTMAPLGAITSAVFSCSTGPEPPRLAMMPINRNTASAPNTRRRVKFTPPHRKRMMRTKMLDLRGVSDMAGSSRTWEGF